MSHGLASWPSFALIVLCRSFAVPAAAQDVKSGDLAKQLTQLLDSKKLDTIAVADAQNPGTYVAAMLHPRHAAPRRLRASTPRRRC